MKILIYASDDAPESHAWAAALVLPGQTSPHWWVSAATPEAAQARLEAFWEKERRHYEARPRKPKAKPLPVVEDPGDVV